MQGDLPWDVHHVAGTQLEYDFSGDFIVYILVIQVLLVLLVCLEIDKQFEAEA